MDLQEHADLVLETYDWLVRSCPDAANRPADVEYPVWVSPSFETTMMADKNNVILELSIDPSLITRINIFKWGAMLNYSYIPVNEADGKAHDEMLKLYGVSDTKAYMSQFYPDIKREIIASWSRLFDESVSLGNPECYGTIWEIRKEWVVRVHE